ncbi:hypothetical protein PCANC_12742 [Puccinia coronata f. sp. avenae]|uniref:Secreted protein n=1 Tax=Puccinia coronata f. sp. avenae TaxID=200324 RepID=A0A2N5VJW1_9BASI|nr:hypothetical protein PCANC_12742 [Puccinia coronata f. sp. avenae]
MQITTQSVLSVLGFLGFALADNLLPPNFPPPKDIGHAVTVPSTPPVTKPPHVSRPKHTRCYNYFLDKDDCVFSARKASERCGDDGKCGRDVPDNKPQVFKSHKKQSSFSALSVSVGSEGIKADLLKAQEEEGSNEVPVGTNNHQLVRRYDSELDSFAIAGGTGICGKYTDDEPGVCLWANAQANGTASGGWISGGFTKTCGRKIYIQRKGSNETIYAPVVDGCAFDTNSPDPGCFRIGFTKHTFGELKPTAEEASRLIIKDLVWNFDNTYGKHPENAAP